MNKQFEHKAQFINRGMASASPGMEVRRQASKADPATVAELARAAQQIKDERAAEHARLMKEAKDYRQNFLRRLRATRHAADAREIARLKALGVPETDPRITTIRIQMQARQLGVDV